MFSGSSGGRGERHGLIDRRGVRQGVGFDGERADLFDERVDGVALPSRRSIRRRDA